MTNSSAVGSFLFAPHLKLTRLVDGAYIGVFEVFTHSHLKHMDMLLVCIASSAAALLLQNCKCVFNQTRQEEAHLVSPPRTDSGVARAFTATA